jgi:hypothetical protein
MAWAAARFADACLRAMSGEGGIVECSFVASSMTSLPFFARCAVRVLVPRRGLGAAHLVHSALLALPLPTA